MKPAYRIAGALIVLVAMSIADITGLSVKLVPEAQAFRGRGAAFVVGAAVGSAGSSSAEASAAASQQQAAVAQQQAAALSSGYGRRRPRRSSRQLSRRRRLPRPRQAAAAQQQAAAPGTPLPLGTVVAALPPGCTPTPVGGVNYYYCGGNFYQAAYEGSTLKYVTTKPK